ncbi:hypothetical protein DOTSEDRAFT_70489 [Dothistroma septosporum NZE10]|uniref:Uncharacterized protein n=1 Tax=Dothistroma septosporum (strain NZE10 / CBS 128990) TaxID=675120 RepID=N1PVR8_DOTSN|nr:hypothetical protein DOTSEDRAFT_70489 [Dothistroma septosporum NZE10]
MNEPATSTIPQRFSGNLERSTSTLQPGSVAKLVSIFEEILSCTAALSRLEQEIPSTVYELEGSYVGYSTNEQPQAPEFNAL